MAKKTDEQSMMSVTARAPFKIYFEGDAYSLTAYNRIGQFSILPGHADFFSMLTAGEVEIVSDETTTSFDIHRGLIVVRDNEVSLFVNV